MQDQLLKFLLVLADINIRKFDMPKNMIDGP